MSTPFDFGTRLLFAALFGAMLLGFHAQAWAVEPPSAHNPCYDDRKLWPESVKQTAYYKEKWEKARVLVWAQQKGKFKGQVDSPENWLEYLPDGTGGKQATKGPDAKTDVVFPDGDYTVEGPGGWEQWGSFSARHLTAVRHNRAGDDPP